MKTWALAAFVALGVVALGFVAPGPISAQIWTTVCRVYTQTGGKPAPCPTPPAGAVKGVAASDVAARISAAIVAARVSPTPTPAPSGTTLAQACTHPNGAAYPAGCAPYSPTSVWNTLLPNPVTSAELTTDSATIINAEFPNANGNFGYVLRNNEPGEYDGGRSEYFSAATDPVVNFVCANSVTYGYSACWGNAAQVPSSFPIPTYASMSQEPQYDSRMEIIANATNGDEYDFYAGGRSCIFPNGTNWVAGNTMPCTGTFVADCGNFYTGTGLQQGTYVTPLGATAGGQCAEAGLLTVKDLQAGHINHALIVATKCTNPGGVYPAYNQNTNNCTDGDGPQLGYRLWYDVPCATTNALPTRTSSYNPTNALWPYEKALLCSLNQYGAFVMDDLGGGAIANSGVTFATEGMEDAYAYAGLNGNPNPNDIWAAIAAQGWNGNVISGTPSGYERWSAGDTDSNGNLLVPGINLNAHLHYVKACVAQGSC